MRYKRKVRKSADGSSRTSSISTEGIRSIVKRLQMECNRDSTCKTYHTVWKIFSDFYLRLDKKPDTWEERIVLFAGFLIENKKKASTVNSYISALKLVLKEDKIEVSEDRFVLNSLIKACRYRSNHVTIRLLIQRQLLDCMLQQLDRKYLFHDHPQPYLAVMYKSLLATAYYGLFRVGEITAGSHPIKARDVHIGENKCKMLFILRSLKTHCEDMHCNQ